MWMIYITTVIALIEPNRPIEANPIIPVILPLEAYGRKHRFFTSREDCHRFMTQFVIVDGGVEPKTGWKTSKNDNGDLFLTQPPKVAQAGNLVIRKIGCLGAPMGK